MSRNLSPRLVAPRWAIAVLALLACRGASAAEASAEDVLAGKGLFRSGSLYVLRSEDEVKKAAGAAETRLREYRTAAAREKDAARDEADKKTLIPALVKQRAALKQQYDQAMPAIRAQLQAMTGRQADLRRQIAPMRDAARYTNNNFAAAGNNQLVDVHNGLSDQIEELQLQASQLSASYNEVTDRLRLLTRGGDEPGAAEAPRVSAAQRRESYVEALGELRKSVDETKQKYAALAADAEVKGALASLSRRTAKIKYALGPTKKFLDGAKALEKAEEKVTSGTLESTRPEPTSKRKPRTARRK